MLIESNLSTKAFFGDVLGWSGCRLGSFAQGLENLNKGCLAQLNYMDSVFKLYVCMYVCMYGRGRAGAQPGDIGLGPQLHPRQVPDVLAGADCQGGQGLQILHPR